MNEFSVAGQFESYDGFYNSYRENLYRVLLKIKKDGDVVYKDPLFWNLPVMKNATIREVLQKQYGSNGRSTAAEQLKKTLYEVICKEPYVCNDDELENIDIIEHSFDSNPDIHGEKTNSIYRTICKRDSRLLSFEHQCYLNWCLRLKIKNSDNNICDIDIQNIYSDKCWAYVSEIKKWPLVNERYWVEVRAAEIERHEPHFHVTENRDTSREMVFRVNDCSVIEPKGRELKPWENEMKRVIYDWFLEHNSELDDAWKMLHPSIY